MRNACRPMGRFFCLLMWLAAAAATLAAQTSGPAMTQVTDIVYRADGTAAKGTVLISWPGFTTADGKAVAAGSLSVQLGSGGTFAVSLAPNTGAQPAGVYYKVVYQLSGQEPSTEYWVVPATGSTTIGAVRAKLQPPTIAAQVLTRDVAETNYVHAAGDQTLSGVKTFAVSPSVPAPQNPGDAANKGYVDAESAALLASPAPIGSTTPNIGAFTLLNGTANAAAYPDLDCGAKINSALAAGVSEVWVTSAAGTKCTSAIKVGAAQSLKFIQGGTWTFAQPITLGAGASIKGEPKGTNSAPVVLKEANGANLTYLIHMNGGGSALEDVYVDGNYANNSSALDAVWVDNANRVAFHGAEIHNAKRYGIYVSGANSCCGRIDNSSFVADNYNSNLYFAGTTNNSASDWIINGTEFENSVVGYGIEAVNAATARLSNVDVGGNKAGGIAIRTTSGGTAIAWMLSTVQFGNNGGNDFSCDGTAGGNYSASNHIIVGSSFIGLATGTAANTYDSIHLHNCGGSIITGNFFAGGGAQPFRYHYFSDSTLSPVYGTVTGNTFNQGGAATADLNPLSLDRIAGNSMANQPMFDRNVILGNNYPLYCQDEMGSNWNCFLPYGGSLYLLGNPNASSGGKRNIYFQPNGNGSTSLGLYGSGNGTGMDARFGNGTTIQWLDHVGTNHTFASVDSSDRTYIMGNLAGDLQFQPTSGTTEATLTAANGFNVVHGLQVSGNTVIDSSRNATVNNLTVTGTCTGCGSGGGNGGDLASPPAIGSVTPNVGTFTTLTAKSVNGTLNAAAFPGADPCAQINNAIAALPSTGGVVDASGFAASQISSGCATTINAGVAAATLRFGAGTWKLGGNPGINVTAPKVTIECPKASEGDLYNTVAATLMSNGTYPLIADTVQSFHSTDGLTVRNCYMDGNAVGTFGLFLPYGSSGHLENVYTRNFTSAGQFLLGGQWTMMAASSGANGGDGLVLGYDSAVDGNAQFAGNGGSAVHVVSGGNVLHGVGTYKNRLHGIYVDGRAVGDWTGQTAYVQQSFIRPATGNTGSFVYFTQTSGTTGSTRPSFCQTPGCTFSDGSVVWINAGTGYGYTPGSIFESASWNFLESANSTSNGFQAPNGFDADDIRIEGTVAHPAFQNNVSAAMVRQSEANDSPAHGLHLINTNYATINNVQWLGAGYSNNPDLGGLRFEASKGNTVSDVNCWFSYSNCIQLISANNSTFSGLNVVNNGLAATPTAGTYAVSVDAGSVANTVSDLNVRDDRGPAYSRGVSDAGTQTIVGNYRKSNLAANPDSYGAGYVQEFSTASAPTYNAGNGQGFTWKSGGTQTGQLDASGNWTVSGSLSAQSIPGHEYFVSKYASIQAAINAAYGAGVVGGKVVDDRTAAYTGAGFYIPDSVTVELAPVTYAFTGTVTHNNGNNNVAAAIVVEQGAHLAGRSTSSNHGTTIGVSSGFAGDIIATTSVGTGIGSKAQWWHWGSIENLNISGASQTSGRCLVVENMGETARVENILARSCYGNNIEIIGASASQSSIRNITTGRSQTASGIRFTNLAGVGKVDGLSGDCNPASLVSVQENAAGSLTILGLKAEGESSICTGTVQDPVVLLDGVSGFNDHVRIIGGYAFGTSQANFAKFVNAGNAIVETEGLYITGYTNMLNDTVRSVTVPLSNNTSKQPFYYEPGGTTYANQAFTLTGGTFVQGSPAGTPTEIFGLTTGSATLLAAAGNGDNSSILTGGIQISGQNRTTYGTPPEIMARWGYRWLGAGLGYDTTNFDLVPAWNSGDSSTRNLGNALNVCKKGSTTVSCRWPNVYALNVDTTSLTLNGSSVAIPTAGSTTPSMDGTGTAGSSTNFARTDHVHPSDTSRAGNGSCPANQFETGNSFGGPSCSAIAAAALPAALSNTSSVNGTAIPASGTLTQTICSGQVALSASGNSIASGGKYGASSSTPQTITCTGLGTTDNIIVDYASDPSGVTGFAPSANGMLTIIKYPTTNTINLYVYNNTASAITPGSISVNYRVAR